LPKFAAVQHCGFFASPEEPPFNFLGKQGYGDRDLLQGEVRKIAKNWAFTPETVSYVIAGAALIP
jgi:hypothetical protein